MLTALVILGIVILVLAIVGTIVGMARGETFSLLIWIFYAGEWFKMIGELAAFVGKGLASAVSND